MSGAIGHLHFLIITVVSGPGAKSQVSGDPDGYTNRGVRYAREKQYEKAIDEFTKAIETGHFPRR